MVLVAVLAAAGCGRSVVVRSVPDSGPATTPRSATAPARGEYVVQRGDTLYGIAFRNGMDYRDLAARNGISAPYTIYPGQRLRLGGAQAPAPTVAARPAPGGTSAPAAGRQPPQSAPPSSPTAAPSTPPATVPVAGAGAAPATPPPARPVAPGAVSPSGWRWPANGQIVGRFAAGDPTRQGLDIAGNAGDPVLAAADGVVVYSGAGLVGYGELIILKHSDEWLSAYGHNRRRLVEEGQSIKAGQQIAEMGRSGASRDMLHFEIRRNGRPVDPLPLLPPR
ncbi:peptidoglycan DD-metalloendopeptidase family protein [Coralloluteibacterium thermophilus]|uniref:Peptidoglycan DD-metalloendopeptidase family protein n=1 Tax=Coralloluteibacterium thermophilum TaxID=2707049 RepID=A0ABV9NNP6_9GAMM